MTMLEASLAIQVEWRRRVESEYAVSAFAQEFAHRLTMFGAPSELIEQALVMALDELAHARDAAAVAGAAGATGPATYDPQTFLREALDDPVIDLAVAAVPSLCLGETLALRLIRVVRDGARVPVVCDALDRVLHDEPRHAALGWTTLDWLLDLPCADAVRAAIEARLPIWVELLRTTYAGECPQPHLAALPSEARDWGLAPVEEYRAIFARTVERDWLPRLQRRGFSL
jgi:hypothetical protein